MQRKGQNNLEPRSQMSDPFRNNSFKTLKTSQYESKIYQLSNQVKILRQKLIQIEQQKQSYIPNDTQQHNDRANELEKYVVLLKKDNDQLRKENLILKEKLFNLEDFVKKKRKHENNQNGEKFQLASVKSLRQMRNKPKLTNASQINGVYTIKNSQRLSNGTSITTNLVRELLAECNQPSQCSQVLKKQHKIQKDQFYEYKNTEDCFEPFISGLSREQRIRLKRCLIKQKQLLVVDNNIEVGTISPYKLNAKDPPQLTRAMIVITNIGLYPISKIILQYVYNNDLSITRKPQGSIQGKITKYYTQYRQNIQHNQQIKQQLEIIVNNIDFKCVKLNLSYQVNKQKHSHLLILPLSKVKLFRDMPYTSPANKATRIQRVFEHQKKIVNDLSKIKTYFAHVYQSKEKNGVVRYFWKIEFMLKYFWIQSSQVEQNMILGVLYDSDRALAQKILGELVFLFQRL